ncbi:MAG: hypothetical protein J0H55_08615 [Chitinophagaceae bacterium]|nr:hypothetical protein [Chitinophagaceae bacterium]
MKLTFRQRLFLYFTLLFTIFVIGVGVFEYSRERNLKTEALEEKLDVYADLIHSSLTTNGDNYAEEISVYHAVLPPELRITVINQNGKVLYDNVVKDFPDLENHAGRPEIKLALAKGKGADIRESASTHHPYLYYAKKYSGRYVRVALPYNIQLQQFLKAGNIFLYFLGILFLFSLFFIHKITLQFGTTIRRLRDFVMNPDNNPSSIQFPNDELGEIGKKITENYLQLEDNRKSLALEKQKLLQHIQISEEGICFISPAGKVEFYNGLFLQHLNQLAEDPVMDAAIVLKEPVFSPLHQFLLHKTGNYFETLIQKHGKSFSLKANIFNDKSFEVVLTDVTQQEKTRNLKKEMTGNIAHELRTPVTSIRAYLETVLQQPIPEDKKQHFIRQAYNQTITLSELIKDMGMIAKMEEAPGSFEKENVNIPHLLALLKEEETPAMVQKHIEMKWQLPENLTIKGNYNLLNSIFRNLVENCIRYAGENIDINISVFNEDDEYYYFLFYDTGVGIKNEDHLNRIFERFYRVQEGRTRDTGGSGLGLSIVKNAVLFHNGNISVKNRKEGGLEFIFQLHK